MRLSAERSKAVFKFRNKAKEAAEEKKIEEEAKQIESAAETPARETAAALSGGEAPSAPSGGASGGEISPDERAEFEEFKKQKKILEIKRLLKMIDHTLLKQTATRAEIKKLCDEAKEYGFHSVCVQPVYVADCFRYLKDAQAVKIACVVGFPMGENKTETKVFETKKALADGADEIDMVVCISAIKNKDFGYVKREIKKVVKAAKGCPVKAIIETSLLTQDEMVKAAVCARDAGAAFVKTSTGYFGGGAKAEDVRLLKQTVQGVCLVKASGGIKNAEQFKEMVAAGADRIGTSSGTDIAEGIRKE